jgi:hypothetical protein
MASFLLNALRSEFADYAIAPEAADTSEGTWSRSITVRKGLWVGVDIELEQRQGGPVTLEVVQSSKGQAIGVLVGVTAAVMTALVWGDPLLSALGISSVKSTVTVAVSALAFCFVTVPVALLGGRVLGAGAATECAALHDRVVALIQANAGRLANV